MQSEKALSAYELIEDVISRGKTFHAIYRILDYQKSTIDTWVKSTNKYVACSHCLRPWACYISSHLRVCKAEEVNASLSTISVIEAAPKRRALV